MVKALRVVVDARVAGSGVSGGVEQVVIGLAGGLGNLIDGDEEYVFLAYADDQEWLVPYLGSNSRIHSIAPPSGRGIRQKVAEAAPWLGPLYYALRRKTGLVPQSDGTIEALGADVMHFPFQTGFLTKIPSLYHPHDLQHVHLPDLFPAEIAKSRDIVYRTLCTQARIVPVAARWTKKDVVRHFQLAEDKVRVIPLAPSTALYPAPTAEDIDNCRKRFSVPVDFAFYPAQTWPHKNHLALIEALAFLRDSERVQIPLIASGKRNDFYFRIIRPRVHALGLDDQVRFVDFVTPLELQCLYRLSTLCVIPTKFESGCLPMWEAFLAGVPVVCSNVTSLPDQAAGAALIFDPDDPRDIAEAVLRVWRDASLRRELISKGTLRVAGFDWTKSARHFRATYREIGGRPLEPEDRAILAGETTV